MAILVITMWQRSKTQDNSQQSSKQLYLLVPKLHNLFLWLYSIFGTINTVIYFKRIKNNKPLMNKNYGAYLIPSPLAIKIIIIINNHSGYSVVLNSTCCPRSWHGQVMLPQKRLCGYVATEKAVRMRCNRKDRKDTFRWKRLWTVPFY